MDSSSKVNAMTLVYMAKLELKIRSIELKRLAVLAWRCLKQFLPAFTSKTSLKKPGFLKNVPDSQH